MTEKKIDALTKVMFDTLDIMNLAVDEGKIFNKMACNMTEGVCSLDSDASDVQKINARELIYHSDELNLVNVELFKRFIILSKIYELFDAVLDDLHSDEKACSSAFLFEKYFGGDNDRT